MNDTSGWAVPRWGRVRWTHATERLSRAGWVRTDTLAFPWPQNVLCARFGHKPVRAQVPGATTDYPVCARCRRRPLWFGTVAMAMGAAQHPVLAKGSYRTRLQWVDFRSWDQFLRHVAAGREIRWPGDPVTTQQGFESDREATERWRVETVWRGGQPPGVGAKVRLDGPGAETPIDWVVLAGPVRFYGSTNLLGAGLARKVVPEGQSRGVGLEVVLGESGSRPYGLFVRWALWADVSAAAPDQGWRGGLVEPVAATANRVLGPSHVERSTITAPEVLTLRLPEGDYRVQAMVRCSAWSRPRLNRQRLRFHIDVRTETGQAISTGEPDDLRGGWRSVVGWTLPLTDPAQLADGTWKTAVTAECTSRILLDRAHHQGPDWVPTYPSIEQVQ
jgi:hypothetical protein